MTDFLITEMTFYPWFTWLIVFLGIAGLFYVCTWLVGLAAFASDWIAYRRAVLSYKTAVRRRLAAAPCEVCELAEEGLDPPEYEHGDGDWDDLPEPDEDAVEAFLAAVKSMGLLEEEPPAERAGPPVCTDPECDKYGWVHPPPCVLVWTLPVTRYREGPAMPPQPVREYLHPAIMDSLEAAGFSEHETNEGAVDSMVMRAITAEVEAQITDGIIPTGEQGKRQ